jgi:hypothetical protein
MGNEHDTTGPNPAVPDPRPGTTHDADFGRTDRYENKDQAELNVRNLDDERDSPDADPDSPDADINRDE